MEWVGDGRSAYLGARTGIFYTCLMFMQVFVYKFDGMLDGQYILEIGFNSQLLGFI